MRKALDHGPRLLRGGGVVEIDERLAIGALGENGKVSAQRFDVEGRQDRIVQGHELAPPARAPSQRRIFSRSNSARSSSFTRAIASAPKASRSIASASTLGSPRA